MFNEIDFVKTLKEKFKTVPEEVFLGIGDDCAAIRVAENKLLLISTDSLVEDVHFSTSYFNPSEIAEKSIAVSISDIASMGGEPKFILSTIGFPKCLKPSLTLNKNQTLMDGLLHGITNSCDLYNVKLIGGNVTTSEKLFLDITVLGEVEECKIIRRSGAKVGDLVFVTGTLGDSSLGLKLLKHGDGFESESIASAHKAPKPRIEIGRKLSELDLASSMIDVSDGLLIDLERITTCQGVGAEIYVQKIPLSDNYVKLISRFEDDIFKLSLTGGEDYELLFTSPKECKDEVKRLSTSAGINISEIGSVTNEKSVKVTDNEGNAISYEKGGFIHIN